MIDALFRYLIASLEYDSPKFSCVGVALNKDHALTWISHLKRVLEISLSLMEQLKPESPHDSKLMTVYLHLLVSRPIKYLIVKFS